jgi:hypothetical protein
MLSPQYPLANRRSDERDPCDAVPVEADAEVDFLV